MRSPRSESRPVGSYASGVGRAGFPALLIDRGLITRPDLLAAQRHAQTGQLDLAEAFVALGVIREPDCYAALAEAAGLELVDLTVTPSSELAVRLVPERLARRHAVVPLSVDNRTLTYATSRPFDSEVERDLAFATGRRMQPVIAPRTALFAALDRCYPEHRDLQVLAERLTRDIAATPDEGVAPAPATPVADLCHHLIVHGVEIGASEVQLECLPDGVTVRYRLCGVLESMLSLPPSSSYAIRRQLKHVSGVDVDVERRPQDGGWRTSVAGRAVDVRLSTLPTVDGERLALRIVDAASALPSLDTLGLADDALCPVREALAAPSGIVLVAGPTGCGKTTLLYAAALAAAATRPVVSVEEFIERVLPGVEQKQVTPRAGATFASIVRMLVPEPPRVIVVGAIRDDEVARAVAAAVDAGHLVVCAMEAADAAAAIARVATFGADSATMADRLRVVIGQRLVRLLCPACHDVHGADHAAQRGAMHGLASIPASASAGCAECGHTGYAGRAPVTEVWTPSATLHAAIAARVTAAEIRALPADVVPPTMRAQALTFIAAGRTSIEEVQRVLGEDDSLAVASRERPLVLVTDDEPITRMLVRVLLERERFDVLEARHGREAVDLATRERPDLLLIDLNMPEMDGYEAIARLRRDLSLATLPIVVVTAEDGPGIEGRVLELGVDDYIVKPFDPTILLSRVNAVFRRLKVRAA
jgi:type II secretory ATPase GspE/PulE/Tfp pilus assembly ATPase PilB-like protein/CheY-like chemotaxis protein